MLEEREVQWISMQFDPEDIESMTMEDVYDAHDDEDLDKYLDIYITQEEKVVIFELLAPLHSKYPHLTRNKTRFCVVGAMPIGKGYGEQPFYISMSMENLREMITEKLIEYATSNIN